MIIGDVEYDGEVVIVRVDYTIAEMKRLNEIVNGLCSASSWVSFMVGNTSKDADKYEDCEIKSISVYSEIDNKEYELKASMFSDNAISKVLDAADTCFTEHLGKSNQTVFDIEADYSLYGERNGENFPAAYQIKNSDLYGTTKFD